MTKSASFFLAVLLAAGGATLMTAAQTPIAVRYTAMTDNVGMRDSIRMELFRWSTDEERQQLLAAWNVPAATAAAPPAAPPSDPAAAAAGGDNPTPAPAGRGAGGRGGAAGAARGGGANARGGGAPAGAAPPAVPPSDPAVAPAGRGAGGRGAAGAARGGGAPARGGAANARGGAARGGGRGDAAAGNAAASLTPEESLGSALSKAPSVGRLWSSEAAGYSIRYAVRLPQPDGGERIVLITDRRLSPDFWKPAGPGVTNYTFSVIELRLDSKGQGEGKASLTSKVVVDGAGKTYALENYDASTAIFRNVERR